MIKHILAVFFLFAISAQGAMIDCYVCTTDPSDDIIPQCKDPLEGSHTKAVNSSETSCFTMFVKGFIEEKGPPFDFNYTLRGYSDIDKCFEQSLGSTWIDAAESYSTICYECQSDKCNRRTSKDENDYEYEDER